MSYYRGCGRLDKAKKLFGYAVRSVAVISALSLFICIAAAPQIVGIYIPQNGTGLAEYSVHVLRVYSISFLIAGYNIVTSVFLVALEKPSGAIVISLLRSILALAASLLLLTSVFGGEGIWWAAALSEGICVIAALAVLRKTMSAIKNSKQVSGDIYENTA